jgi:hypothetical protein
VASQRGDAACAGLGGWMARRITGHALFSTQDEEDGISACLLDDCVSVGGVLVECVDWEGAIKLKIKFDCSA